MTVRHLSETVRNDISKAGRGIQKEMMQVKLLKNRNRLTDLEDKFMVAEGKRWEEQIVREFGTDMYTLLYFKMENEQGPENSA